MDLLQLEHIGYSTDGRRASGLSIRLESNATKNRVRSDPILGNWESLGGYGVDGCAVASRAPNRLDLFMVGGDRAFYHRGWDGSAWSSNWEKFDAYCVGTPAAVSWGPNRVDAFVIGGDRQ